MRIKATATKGTSRNSILDIFAWDGLQLVLVFINYELLLIGRGRPHVGRRDEVRFNTANGTTSDDSGVHQLALSPRPNAFQTKRMIAI